METTPFPLGFLVPSSFLGGWISIRRSEVFSNFEIERWKGFCCFRPVFGMNKRCTNVNLEVLVKYCAIAARFHLFQMHSALILTVRLICDIRGKIESTKRLGNSESTSKFA